MHPANTYRENPHHWQGAQEINEAPIDEAPMDETPDAGSEGSTPYGSHCRSQPERVKRGLEPCHQDAWSSLELVWNVPRGPGHWNQAQLESPWIITLDHHRELSSCMIFTGKTVYPPRPMTGSGRVTAKGHCRELGCVLVGQHRMMNLASPLEQIVIIRMPSPQRLRLTGDRRTDQTREAMSNQKPPDQPICA